MLGMLFLNPSRKQHARRSGVQALCFFFFVVEPAGFLFLCVLRAFVGKGFLFFFLIDDPISFFCFGSSKKRFLRALLAWAKAKKFVYPGARPHLFKKRAGLHAAEGTAASPAIARRRWRGRLQNVPPLSGPCSGYRAGGIEANPQPRLQRNFFLLPLARVRCGPVKVRGRHCQGGLVFGFFCRRTCSH